MGSVPETSKRNTGLKPSSLERRWVWSGQENYGGLEAIHGQALVGTVPRLQQFRAHLNTEHTHHNIQCSPPPCTTWPTIILLHVTRQQSIFWHVPAEPREPYPACQSTSRPLKRLQTRRADSFFNASSTGKVENIHSQRPSKRIA